MAVTRAGPRIIDGVNSHTRKCGLTTYIYVPCIYCQCVWPGTNRSILARDRVTWARAMWVSHGASLHGDCPRIALIPCHPDTSTIFTEILYLWAYIYRTYRYIIPIDIAILSIYYTYINYFAYISKHTIWVAMTPPPVPRGTSGNYKNCSLFSVMDACKGCAPTHHSEFLALSRTERE